jgi:translation initiation factor IF-3
MANNQKPYVKKGPFKKQREHLINEEIDYFEVRVVGEGTQTGVMPRNEALKLAYDQGVDLVQITEARGDNPPICKLIEYNKYLYELKKKKHQNAGNKSVLKTIKISQHIGEHDMLVKAKQAHQFLKDNNKVRVELQFRGREIVYKDQGKLALLKLAEMDMVKEVGRVESLPVMENKKMFIMISPRKK